MSQRCVPISLKGPLHERYTLSARFQLSTICAQHATLHFRQEIRDIDTYVLGSSSCRRRSSSSRISVSTLSPSRALRNLSSFSHWHRRPYWFTLYSNKISPFNDYSAGVHIGSPYTVIKYHPLTITATGIHIGSPFHRKISSFNLQRPYLFTLL